MNVQEAIRVRQSCRAYSDRPVEREKLVECLEAVRMAPSACNSQPWRLIAVRDPETLGKVRPCLQALGMNKFINDCGTLVVLCEEPANLSAKLGGKLAQQEYAQMDVGIAAAHFCLRAAELGLGTCILGWMDADKMRDALGLKGYERPRLTLALGYPKEDDPLREKKRKPADEVWQIIE